MFVAATVGAGVGACDGAGRADVGVAVGADVGRGNLIEFSIIANDTGLKWTLGATAMTPSAYQSAPTQKCSSEYPQS